MDTRIPILVFLPGKSHGQKILVGYTPWGCKDSDMTEFLNHSLSSFISDHPSLCEFHLSAGT